MRRIVSPRKVITAGLSCAVLSPIIVGVLGVVAGMISIAKDARCRGAMVVTLM